MRAQQLLNKVWQWLGEDKRLIQILVALLIVQALVVLLPQSPISNVTSPGYSRWLAEQRSILKGWIAPLSTLGFLTLRTSIWMRGLLVVLALLVATRLGDVIEQWNGLAYACRWLRVLSCVAGVLVLAGWGANTMGLEAIQCDCVAGGTHHHTGRRIDAAATECSIVYKALWIILDPQRAKCRSCRAGG